MPPLTVQTRCPEIGKLGVPFTLTLVVENHTTSLQVRFRSTCVSDGRCLCMRGTPLVGRRWIDTTLPLEKNHRRCT